MGMKVNISVIIPVYNAGRTLIRAVDSILMQEYESMEVVLVDDGSTDDSAVLCDELASQEPRVRVIHKENGGVSSARNAGLEVAEGEYVMFLDADDVIRPDSLSMMYGKGWDMVLGGFAKLENLSIVESYVPDAMNEYRAVEEINAFLDSVIAKNHSYLLNSACFKLFRLSLIKENDLRFDEVLRYGEDKMFVFSFLCHTRRVRTVPEIVYDYILQPGSLSSDLVSDSHLSQIFGLMERYLPLLEALKQRYPVSVRLWDMVLGGFAKLENLSIVESYVPDAMNEYRAVEEINAFLDSVIAKNHSYLLNSACFKLFRLSLIKENDLRFDEVLRYGEDKMFVFSFLCHTRRVRTVPEIVYDYILQPGSLSSDLVSDSHLSQIFGLMERYLPLLEALKQRYPVSVRLRDLYHVDFIGRYVCRILTVFARYRSEFMTKENIALLYSYMSADKDLGLFSIRPGQIVNILLYKIGKPSFTASVYRLTSRRSR